MDEAVVQTGPACSETYSTQIDRNNAARIENSQRVRTGVGDEPSVQCCPLTWSRRRSQPHCEPIRHNPECSLRRIHQNAGSFVRPLFLISVGPSTNFRTMRDRNTFLNHNGKPFTHLPVCTALWGSHLRPDRSHPRLHWGFFSVLLPGYLRMRVFPSEFSLANSLYVFLRNGRERCFSFRNDTSAVNSVYELLSPRAAVC